MKHLVYVYEKWEEKMLSKTALNLKRGIFLSFLLVFPFTFLPILCSFFFSFSTQSRFRKKKYIFLFIQQTIANHSLTHSLIPTKQWNFNVNVLVNTQVEHKKEIHKGRRRRRRRDGHKWGGYIFFSFPPLDVSAIPQTEIVAVWWWFSGEKNGCKFTPFFFSPHIFLSFCSSLSSTLASLSQFFLFTTPLYNI